MSDSGYTPTTAEVKSAWVGSKPNIGMLVVRDMHAAEFDCWLAAHDVQVRADQAERDAGIIRYHRGGYNRTGSSHKLLLKMEDAIRGQSFTGTESE